MPLVVLNNGLPGLAIGIAEEETAVVCVGIEEEENAVDEEEEEAGEVEEVKDDELEEGEEVVAVPFVELLDECVADFFNIFHFFLSSLSR